MRMGKERDVNVTFSFPFRISTRPVLYTRDRQSWERIKKERKKKEKKKQCD
jgi:hypothetical protein